MGVGREVPADDAKAKGKRKQGRPLELPEPEPWPDEVVGASLFLEIAATIRTFVVMGDDHAAAVVLWIIGAHAIDSFAIFPRLFITSPEKQCGKTTLLDIVSHLVPRSLFASNVTSPALFRAIEMAKPTLLLDEFDGYGKGDEDLRTIVNAGHRKDGTVLRAVGEDFEPRQFSVWAPAAIAAIGRIPGTIEDRSIIIPLRRRRPDETVMSFSTGRKEAIALLERLARQAARWAADHATTIGDADPAMPTRIINRAEDNWRPLLAIADAAGGEWPKFARRIAEAMVAATDDQSIRAMLLADIRDIFTMKGDDRLTSVELTEALGSIEGRPWADWKHGKPLTPNGLARLLKPFAVAPSSIRLDSGATPKGYKRSQFDDVFRRYLLDPPSPTATPPQLAESVAFSPNQTATPKKPVAVCKPPQLAESVACGGVAVQKRGNDEDTQDKAEDDWPDLPAFLDRRPRDDEARWEH
jgi:putative DNA primase/helicase